jgi:hypothetical protein
MKKIFLITFILFISQYTFSGNVEKTFHMGNYTISNAGQYKTLTFENARLSGLPGEPTLPYIAVSLMLPPGESAESIEIIRENEVVLDGSFNLFPQQKVLPISKSSLGVFIKNESVYRMNANYPSSAYGHLFTQYLNGYAFALSTFTPVNYNPATGKLSYFQDITVRIKTHSNVKSHEALKNLTVSRGAMNRVRSLAQNPEMMNNYPSVARKKTGYTILIITPFAYEDGFTDLISYYGLKGMPTHLQSVEDINSGTSGLDIQDKIRNYIKQEYQNNGIEYVILGGNNDLLPARGFYCVVDNPSFLGGGVEEQDWDIPADLYYSGLDGTDDLNNNQIYGEVDDSTDLLPDVSVGRLPFSNSTEQASMVHKTIYYQAYPVHGESTRPLFVAEYLWSDPVTLGSSYMNLLIDNHSDNGYYSNGFPSASNHIQKLYDTLTGGTDTTAHWSWTVDSLLVLINSGTSFIHHLGHANTNYMLRMLNTDITDSNFYAVNGVTHNYSLLYTQGCYDGSFDMSGCIASQSLAIDNFVVAGIFNSRYGWFDQGTSDGPSEHLQREFVSALYNDTLADNHIGNVLMQSKIMTAPWIGLPSEFEPGAQRWSQYDNNLLGDPALWIWISEPVNGVAVKSLSFSCSVYPNPAHNVMNVNYSLPASSNVTLRLLDATGQSVGIDRSWNSQVSGNHLYSFDISNLSSGVYYCRIEASNSIVTKKLVVIK